MRIKLVNGDSLGYLKTLGDNSIDSVVCDPPYGLSQLKQKEYLKVMGEWAKGNLSYIPKKKGFMGQSWDGFVPPPSLWLEVLRILKPGGHALVFAGSRTQDLMGLSLRIAGFEIRDCIQWVYGSGFPKSYNVGKGIDKLLGNEVGNEGYIPNHKNTTHGRGFGGGQKTDPFSAQSKEAKEWEGWGTALKPAYEPILLVRKPLEGTVARNALEHGVGGINIDGCRVGNVVQDTSKNGRSSDVHKNSVYKSGLKDNVDGKITVGRFPSNFIMSHKDDCECKGLKKFKSSSGRGAIKKSSSSDKLGNTGSSYSKESRTEGTPMICHVNEDGSETMENWECVEDCPVQALDSQTGTLKSGKDRNPTKSKVTGFFGSEAMYYSAKSNYGDSGGASRFFYCAKASKSERESNQVGKDGKRFNIHPTVKPIKLMSYLVRLITPKGGKVLDPFMGSGTTGLACIEEGFDFLGVELNQDYFEIAKVRIDEKASNK